MSGVVSAIKEFLGSEDSEYEIITIESLKQSEKSFSGRLRQHDPSYSDEADHGYMQLQDKPATLVGKLTAQPNSRQDSQGQVFFVDDSGTLPCQIIADSFSLSKLDKQVFLPSWNFILYENNKGETSERRGYLEILDTPVSVYMTKQNERDNQTDCICVTDAVRVLTFRDKLGIELINVRGQVTAISEVIKIKKDNVFVIRLEDKDFSSNKIDILVKNEEFLHWQQFLKMNEEYILTRLRPTTLNKGSKDEQKLFVPWRKSRLIALSLESSCIPLTLMEWIEKYVGSCADLHALVANYTVSDNHSGSNFRSYHGRVSSNENADKGVYELDGKIRLYLSYTPAVSKMPALRVGTEITVYNAHAKREATDIVLCCCFYGCIRITRFSPWNSPSKLFEHGACCSIHMINKYSVNLTEFIRLLLAEQSLQEKLQPTLVKRLTTSLFQHLYSASQSVNRAMSQSGEDLMVRKMVQEFVCHGDSCCILRDSQSDRQGSTFPSILDLIKLLTKCEREELCDSKSSPYYIIDSKSLQPAKTLVGILTVDSQTGQIQLKDKSGVMDCIVVPSGNESKKHKCINCQFSRHNATDVTVIEDGSDGLCPYIHTWHLNYLLCIRQFHIIRENQYSTFGSHYVENQSQNGRTYALFSMSDAATYKIEKANQKTLQTELSRNPPCLKRPFSYGETNKKDMKIDSKSTKVREGSDMPAQCKTSDHIGSSEKKCVCQLLRVVYKDSIIHKALKSTQSDLAFYAQVTCIGNSVINSTDGHSISQQDICVNLDDGEKILTSSKDENSASSNNHLSEDELNKPTVKSATTTSKKLPSEEIALLFEGTSIKWYHFLHPGCLYRLVVTNCSDSSVLQAKFDSSALKEAVEKLGTRKCIVVTCDMQIHQVNRVKGHDDTSRNTLSWMNTLSASEAELLSHADLEHPDEAASCASISDILTQRPQYKLVSVTGVIISREDLVSHSDHYNTSATRYMHNRGSTDSESTSIKIKIGETDGFSNHELSVYINTDRFPCPLGFIVGSQVEFTRLERKISKRGQVYCTYIAPSCARILHFHRRNFDMYSDIQMKDMKLFDLQSLKRVDLADLYAQPMLQTNICLEHCHIHQVKKILFMSLCSDCGSVYKSGHCSSVVCCSTQQPIIQAKSSLLVEDGTTTAMLYCNDVSALRRCILIDELLWQEIEEYILIKGNLFYQQNKTKHHGDKDSMEESIAQLAERDCVKRAVTLYIRQMPYMTHAGKAPLSTDVSTYTISDFELRPVHIGQTTIQTRMLPFLQLICLGVDDVKYGRLINQMMMAQ